MSYDGGATPASVDMIRMNNSWTDTQLGLLGSLDKVGMTLSSPLWGRALQRAPAKALIALGLGLNAVSTLLFGLLKSRHGMYAAKLFMGITQALQGVWGTCCWVLLWAPSSVKTSWLGLGAVAAGIGSGIGTAIAGFATSHQLPYSFAFTLQAVVLGLLWCLLLWTSSSVLSIDLERPGMTSFKSSPQAAADLQDRAVARGDGPERPLPSRRAGFQNIPPTDTQKPTQGNVAAGSSTEAGNGKKAQT
eukprot:CAMPEP_0170588634 /NCGR_PEP_ID=MMETSP0224-20130122/10936_1 /TAXON_ID=285029 /ORGANISM="Togula jolla, Strain CCCM 725" /LENGTH=246 /DNA_ID=CAMNT_0010912367 /DNA_START=9 /DNA_END=745 /DNA_ORIENTATION=+